MENKKEEKKVEKQLVWIVGSFVVLVLVFLIGYHFFKSLNTEYYQGLKFTKERFDQLIVYHHMYTFITPQGKKIEYNLYVRTNPNENTVPIEGKITFLGPNIAVGANASSLVGCAQNALALGTLSQFLGDNQFKVKAGSSDEQEARENNVPYVTCDKYNEINGVEISGNANETKIIADGKCVKIFVGPQCNVLEAVEKFEIQTVADSKSK